MTVTAPRRPPTATYADSIEALDEEALIKEARERARRRHQKYAAAAAIAAAVVGVGAAFVTRAAGGDAHRRSASARPLAPASSATRSTIVFATWRGLTATLYRIRPDGTGLHRLLRGSLATVAGHSASSPALSPDGREVAFQAGPPLMAGPAGIDIVKLDGRGLHEVVAHGEHPAWSPDGTHLVYNILIGKSRGIYVVRADGTARHRLARSGYLPAWSPNGAKIAYECPTQSLAHICVMNADGTRQHRIAPVADSATPVWSPDGSQIAFIGGFPDDRVYVMNADGTNLRRLAPPVSYGTGCGPAWSPNGKRIAFSREITTIEDAHGSHVLPGGIYLMNADGRHVVLLKATHVVLLKAATAGIACGITWQRDPTNG